MKDKIIKTFGWYGTLAILLAYVLVSFSIINVADIWYQILNVTGAIGLIAISRHQKDYPSEVLNIIWAIIAIIAILKIVDDRFDGMEKRFNIIDQKFDLIDKNMVNRYEFQSLAIRTGKLEESLK